MNATTDTDPTPLHLRLALPLAVGAVLILLLIGVSAPYMGDSRPITPPASATPTAMESVVAACASASGIAPNATLTPKQMRDWTSCIDLVRAAVARSK